MTPEPLKCFRPLVKRTDRLRVRSIKHPPPVAPHVDQAHLKQHPQVLRYRRLLQPQQIHNLPYRPLLQRQIAQDRPPPRLRHGIKRIRSCRRPCHELNNTFPYGNMSSTIFSPLSSATTAQADRLHILVSPRGEGSNRSSLLRVRLARPNTNRCMITPARGR